MKSSGCCDNDEDATSLEKSVVVLPVKSMVIVSIKENNKNAY